jgi:hypothetical protein
VDDMTRQKRRLRRTGRSAAKVARTQVSHKRKTSVQPFRESPLSGVKLGVTRDKDVGRGVELALGAG